MPLLYGCTAWDVIHMFLKLCLIPLASCSCEATEYLQLDLSCLHKGTLSDLRHLSSCYYLLVTAVTADYV